ncbi:alpha-glucoside:hydrogen symporter [Kockovaella imperatae]|uniref:Alpha-glucoside:hydrogen symporter n=1 Tax=Kockovaella imperatae TaxID=4999 RepID=A0A1Y1UTY9_9TREE|nr:alpha-glucoside:hydrogen symporter [Kockovaella imperatae]ORX41087.1 alpha-glucoside:hydrogen symporter [Kockovaella imperatae]
MNDKDVLQDVQIEIEKGADVPVETWKHVVDEAIGAEVEERSMTVREAFKLYPKAVFWSFAISLTLIMEGFDTSLEGVTGLPWFRRDFGIWAGEKDGYQLIPAWQSAIGYCSSFSAIGGIVLASWFQDRYGYRRCIQFNLILLTAFQFIIFFANTIEVFFVGKLLVGIPFGGFSSSAVSYSAEVTPVQLRGYLTTYNNLCWVIGQFMASGVLRGTSVIDSKWSYKIPYAVQWIWPIPLFLLAHFAPESPWWLVSQGKLDEAEKAVQKLQSKTDRSDPARAVSLMVRTNQLELEHSAGTSFLDCFKGTNLRRTEIACMAWSAQVLCGTWFGGGGSYFFEQAGLSTTTSFSFGIGGSAMGIAGTFLAWAVITFVGRRKIFLWGLGILGALLFSTGFAQIANFRGSKAAPWVQAVISMLFTFAYDSTIGPVAYSVAAEIPSTRLRGKTVGLARNAYNLWAIVAGVIAPYMTNPLAWNWIGYAGFFWGVSCLLVGIWAFFRLPETKGRTFRELDISVSWVNACLVFENKVPTRKFVKTQVSLDSEEIVH